MKLVKSTTLIFAEGRSEKVYAIDLCEVGAGQFVVNFRYGKRGAPLKDGSKTVAPVGQAEAERVYDKLVQQQLEKGYLPEGAPRPAPPIATPSTSPAAAARGGAPAGGAAPAQKDRILERLAASGGDRRWFKRDGHAKTWNLERAIWRAGELRVREAEPLLLRLVGTAPAGAEVAAGGKGLRDYCIAWALGRLGGPASMETLTRLYNDAQGPKHVQRIATLALLALSDEAQRAELATHMIAALPPALQATAAGTDSVAFANALREYLASAGPDAWGAVDVAYVIDTPTVRPAVLEQLALVPLTTPYFYFVRHIFKAAEYKRDALVFGLLAYRFEKTRANFSHANYSYNARRPTSPMAYGAQTRRYLRHRVWRTLRRAGQIGDLDYVKLAVGVLLPFTDDDASEPRASYNTSYDKWAPYIALNHVLYENSPRYEPSPSRSTFRLKRGGRPGGPPPAVREEAFPKRWEARPEGLVHLLAESACLPVHEFAAKAIRAVPAFLDQLDIDDLVMLLGRPYEITARLGLELAERRYDRNAPDLSLLLGMARSVYAPARTKAFAWLDEARTRVLADGGLVAELVLAAHADTRDFARRLLRSTALSPEAGSLLVARIVTAMLRLGRTPEDDQRARDATQTLVATLAPHLATVGHPVIKDLLAHSLSGVQELGAELLLRAASDPRAPAIPDEVMVQILHSEHENVRAVGLRLLAELPDAVLAKMELLLVRLSTDKNADLRNASRPIVKRIATSHPAAGETIARALVEALLRRKLPEEAPSHVLRVLKEDLFDLVTSLPTEDVWRLLQSASAHAQELGGLLLQRVDPSSLQIDQIAKLASHDILSVRQAAWAFYDKSEARIRASMAEASRILDATWEDSRAFAFAFFRDRLGPDAFDADVLVTILDSVREDVQAFGRELAQKYFKDEDGPVLMTKLSEHPSVAVQRFTTNYLARFAAGDSARLALMVPYFTSVLSRVNQGRVAKQRVLAFLEEEGGKNEEAARLVLGILHRISATIAVEYRGAAIAAMVSIHHSQPGVVLPLRIKEPELRGRNGIPLLV
ncbi:MAG TPA: hypothetical protein VLT33_16265 [Labilithrix sp.]|nr:hypothetical protein [Labilithrix sp.]